MDDKPFVADGERAADAALTQAAVGQELQPEPPSGAGAEEVPGLEYPPPDLPSSQAAPFSLRTTLQMSLVLAMMGWLSFLYFSNDNLPVSEFRLSMLLPRPADGWKGGILHSSNPTSVSIAVGLKFEKFLSASASRTYTRAGKEVTVEIWDWAGDYPYHMPIDIPGWANGEAVRAGAEEGRLRYNAQSKKGRLRVRYLDRFYLIVEGTGIERYELESWYRRIDLAGLRREFVQLQRTASSR
jgi:hypothetical protein